MTVVINGTTGIDTGTGSLIAADATTPTYLDLFEDTDNGSNYVRLIAPTSVAANRTITLPDNTGTILTTASTFAGTGPAFSAVLGTAQTGISSAVETKLRANVEEFDTASCYDNSTNFRFTPNVAGYYYLSGQIYFAATSVSVGYATIYKNGVRVKDGQYISPSSNPNLFTTVHVLIYLNGTTDYVELYGFCTGTGALSFQVTGINSASYFQGFLARAA